MDLTNIGTIKNLCSEYGILPNKNFGQNFLIDREVLEKMILSSELKNSDIVLEIGPGFGTLTYELLKSARKVIAVEKDKKLFDYLNVRLRPSLRQGFGGQTSYGGQASNKLEIINEDILEISNFFVCHSERTTKGGEEESFKLDPSQEFGMTDGNYKIISNLPYQITSPVLWKFLQEEKDKPGLLVLMVQKEVGERICAKPGEMSVLSVMCQFYAECEFLFEVKRDKFYPVPAVDSAVIKIKIQDTRYNFQKNSKLQISNSKFFSEKDFFRLVKIGFSARRKMLKNNLSAGLHLPAEKILAVFNKIGLNEKVRPQDLTVWQWIDLAKENLTSIH